jgi:Protein kinase domain/PEGA domain
VLPRNAEPRTEADGRFARAVEAVAVLEHPHIVPVFDHGVTDHLCWYSMEYVRGRSLRNFILQRGPLELKACQRVVAQVASALDYAHRRGIVHGSLKPENVLIDADGWVHVCDLLVARTAAAIAAPLAPEAQEQAAAAARSPYAAADEVTTPFSDQYALAVLVLECLAGPSLLDHMGGNPGAALAAQRPDIPLHVTHAIQRALSPKPIDRFPGVLDFVAALETYAVPMPDVRPSGRRSDMVLMSDDWEPPPRPFGWGRLLRIAAALAIVGALAVPLRPTVVRLVRAVIGTSAAPATEQPSDSAAIVAPPRTSAGSTLAPRPSRPGSTLAVAPTPAVRQSGGGQSRGEAPARRQVPAAAPAAEPGRLFVNATPWGQLYVDGQLVGNTPRANLSVAPGAHTIRVLREGYQPFERAIQVEAGQTVRLTDIELVARP